jgi:two-component system sensor histidine kinase/response regulator
MERDVPPLPSQDRALAPDIYVIPLDPKKPHSRDQLLLTKLSGAWGVAIGLLVIFGWYAHSMVILQVFTNLPPMKYNTAVGLLLSGMGVFLLPFGRARWTSFLGGIVCLLGFGTVAEYILHKDLGIDQFLLADTITSATPFPGRMSPLAASCFMFFGCALTATADAEFSRRKLTIIAILACVVIVTVSVALLGYPFGIDTAYGWGTYTRMALHTAASFFILSAGLIVWVRHLADRINFNFVRWLPVTSSLTLMVMVAIVAMASFSQLQTSAALRKHSYDVLITAQTFLGDLLDLQRGMRGYVLTGRPESLVTYQAGAGDAPRQLDKLEISTSGNPEQEQRLKTLSGDLDKLTAYSHKLIGTRDSQGLQAAIQVEETGEGFDLGNRIIADFHAFTNAEHGLLDTRSGLADSNFHNTVSLVFFGSALAVVLLFLSNLLAAREMRRRGRVEEKMHEIAAFQEAMLNSTDYAIISTDLKGVVTSFNTTAASWLGYTPEEVIGKTTPALWHDRREVAARSYALSIELGRPVEPGFDAFVAKVGPGRNDQSEWTFIRKDGSRFPVSLSATALVSTGGRVIGYLGVINDITARKQVEKKLQDQALILDQANDAIFVRDNDSRVVYWNQGAERLYGWSKEEVEGRVTHELFKTQFPVPLELIEAQVLGTGFWQGELVHTRRDGSRITVVSHWGLRSDETGQPSAIIESNYDISARKRAEKELAESRERLNTILNGSIDGVVVYEAIRDRAGEVVDFRFEMVNPAAERLMGMTASELLGRTLLAKFPNTVQDGLFEKFTHVIERNEALDFEYQSSRHFPPRWYRLAGVKLGDGVVLSYAEITARKQYEQALHDAKERAESADSAKSNFLANMSHEIRTPMNGVIGMTGLLLDTNLDSEQHALAETIRSSGESLLGLINDILDFSKIEAGKLSFEELDFDLRKVVEDTVELLAAQAQAKGLELIAGVDPSVVTKLRGDPGRVQQVLTNLIGNAIKFTPAGEVSIRAVTELETEDDVLLRFEIKDTGVGISREAKARLFHPFVQADGSTARMFGGTGLGLAICKRLAESMHGDIGAESYPGKGSKFWVTMRFKRQADAKAKWADVPEFIDTRVLVVDDNKTTRQFLHDQILAWRMRAGSAESGEEALAILRQAVIDKVPYQVAILDMIMPEIDGMALARKIHADPQLASTRIILLTPFGKPLPAEEMKLADISAACLKPVRQSTLFDALALVLTQPENLAATASAGSLTRVTAPLPKRRERVLLAEDNLVNQRVALGNLEKLGYRADVVNNGIAVLEAVERQKYDVILMDCQMPDLDGYQATKEIRKREKNSRHTWIIAMTANVMVGDREKCLAAGMDDYVSKPLRREELRAALARVVTGTMPSLDVTMLKSLQEDGEDEFAELIELFVTSAPGSITDMKRALEKSDAKALAMAAHTLKGSCSNWGPSPLREMCAELEIMGRAGRIESAAAAVASAEAELYRFIDALKPYRTSKTYP